MKRIRTIQQAAAEILEADPGTAIHEYAIRQLVISGACPSFKRGRKFLLDFDLLLSILSGETVTKQPEAPAPGNFFQNNVRKIGGNANAYK